MHAKFILAAAAVLGVACGDDSSKANGGNPGEPSENVSADGGNGHGENSQQPNREEYYRGWRIELTGFEGRDEIPNVAGGLSPSMAINDDIIRLTAQSLAPETTTLGIHFDPRIVGEKQVPIEFTIGSRAVDGIRCRMIEGGDPVMLTYTPDQDAGVKEGTFEGPIVCIHDPDNPIEGTISGWFKHDGTI